MMPKGVTTYSKEIPGETRNYNKPVRFDLTDGFLGISQEDGANVRDRVLLSPAQVRELLSFVAERH